MLFEEFGEVIISKGEKFPKGLVLRTKKDFTVVLEEYLDTFGENVDVIFVFGQSFSLKDEEDLEYCLSVAREYERNLDEPIYVFLEEEDETANTTKENEKRAKFLARVVAWNRTHDWSVIPPIQN